MITMCRPDYVRTCLEHLAAQTLTPVETVVVDASPDHDTERMLGGEFPSVGYVRNPVGYGAMATSRNLGLQRAHGDVVVFIDDDAFAEPAWLAEMVAPFADPTVGAVGGRVLRGTPEQVPANQIGRMLPDGTLIGHFDADPGRPIDVDHVQGASMAYRRSLLLQLGGIRDGYPGTCVREETDLCLRVREAGYRIVFAPAAVVDHVAAPYTRGKRFDLRYDYYAQRNHLVLLVRHFGYRDPIMRRYLATIARRRARLVADPLRRTRTAGGGTTAALRASARAMAGAAATAAGTGGGLVAGWVERNRDRRSDAAPPGAAAPGAPSAPSVPADRL